MQSSRGSKAKIFSRKVMLTENLQNLDFEFDFISPWNDASSRKNQLSPPRYHTFKTLVKMSSKNGKTQDATKNSPTNSRMKTEGSKNLELRKYESLRKRTENNSGNYFVVNFLKQKTGNSHLKLKKRMHTKSRQKLKTPIFNLNEYSFAERFRQQFCSIIPRRLNKEKDQLKNQKKEGFRPFYKENSFFSGVKIHKPQLKKIMTQKTIPFSKMPVTPVCKQKIMSQLGNTSNNLSGIFPQKLRRIMQSQVQPVITKIKSKSLNKFNKTFY